MSEASSPFIEVETPSSSTSSSIQHHPRYHRHQRCRCSCTVLVCFVLVSLAANAFLLCVVVFDWKPWTDHSEDPHQSEQTDSKSKGLGTGTVCFTCDYFGPEIESNDTLYDVTRLPSGQAVCCLKQKKDDVTELFQKIISDEYSQDHAVKQPLFSKYGRHGSLKPVGAHLYMRPQGVYPPRWTAEDIHNTAFCSGVACREGNITIPEKGKYLVYSHITINNDRGVQSNLLHEIRRTHPQLSGLGDKPLLFSKATPSTSPQKTSFLSAILQLRSKDVLRVTISKDYLYLLDDGRFANYFGVIKM